MKIFRGLKIFVFLIFLGGALGLGQVSSPAIALTEKVCMLLVEKTNGSFTYLPFQDFSLLEETKKEGDFKFDFVSDMKPVGFICTRSSLVPGKNDYKVLIAGFSLYLSAPGGNNTMRAVSYKYEAENFEYTVTNGKISERETKKIEKRLAEFQALINPE